MSEKDIKTTKSEIEQALESVHGRLRKIKDTLALIRQQGDIEVPSRGYDETAAVRFSESVQAAANGPEQIL